MEFLLKRGFVHDLQVARAQLLYIRVQHLRNKGAAEGAIVSLRIGGTVTARCRLRRLFRCHFFCFSPSSIARTFFRSFTPGLCSNLLLISIENNLAATGSRAKAPNFSTSPGSMPPLKKNNLSIWAGFNTSQLNFLPVPP